MNIQKIITDTQRHCLELQSIVDTTQDIVLNLKANPLRSADFAVHAFPALQTTCANNINLLRGIIENMRRAIALYPEHSDMLNLLAAKAHDMLLRTERIYRMAEKSTSRTVVN